MYRQQEKLWKRVWQSSSQQIAKPTQIMLWKPHQILSYVAKRCLFLQVNRYLAKILATSLSDKKDLHSSLAIENITNTDYKHVERAWEDFGIQNLLQSILVKW